ncbi:hypothetical protein BH23GEM6_BH23GEM6_11330 [soil metagenome]
MSEDVEAGTLTRSTAARLFLLRLILLLQVLLKGCCLRRFDSGEEFS